MALTKVPAELSSTPGIVDGSNGTAITIDQNQNVMVGTTDTAPGAGDTNEGFSINSSRVFVSRASDYSLSLNRTTDNGPIAIFRKDGSTIGSIGVESGDNFIIEASATDHAGLLLWGSGGSGRVTSRLNGSEANGTVDLGRGVSRWKDLYLSGGVYLGGTGAANKLDEYEETTWTPTQSGVTLSVSIASAIRVGNLVTLACRLSFPANTDSSNVAIGGLPFTYDSNWQSAGAVMTNFVDLPPSYTQLNYFLGGSTIQLYAGGDDVGWSPLANRDLSGGQIIFNVTYQTNA
jgi:hypothetical protein